MHRGASATAITTVRCLAIAAAVVNTACMYIAAATTDPRMFASGFIGAALSTYGWLHFHEEAEETEGSTINYESLAMRLRCEFLEANMSPGQRLPSTREIAEKFGVTRRTSLRAMNLLKEEGLVDVLPGRGFFIPGGKHKDLPRERLEWHLLKTFSPGEHLPPFAELQATCGVSQATVYRVVSDLLRQGILRREGGTFYRT
jgi:DNA-binding GntR family transcriptional regulator